MYNDLATNMYRAELDRKADERRLKMTQMRRQMTEITLEYYNTLTERLDAAAKENGYLKDQMVQFAKNQGLHDFAVFYQNHSSAWDGTKN